MFKNWNEKTPSSSIHNIHCNPHKHICHHFLYFVVQTLRVTSDKPHPKEHDKLHLNVVLGFPHLVSVCWCERRLHHPRSGSLCSGSEDLAGSWAAGAAGCSPSCAGSLTTGFYRLLMLQLWAKWQFNYFLATNSYILMLVSADGPRQILSCASVKLVTDIFCSVPKTTHNTVRLIVLWFIIYWNKIKTFCNIVFI